MYQIIGDGFIIYLGKYGQAIVFKNSTFVTLNPFSRWSLIFLFRNPSLVYCLEGACKAYKVLIPVALLYLARPSVVLMPGVNNPAVSAVYVTAYSSLLNTLVMNAVVGECLMPPSTSMR